MEKLIDEGKMKEAILYEFDEMLMEIESYDRDGSLLVEHAMKRIEQVINEQPEAYSVEKVVKALEGHLESCAVDFEEKCIKRDLCTASNTCIRCAFREAINIVKDGWNHEVD